MATLAGELPVEAIRLGIVGAARILPAHPRGMKALLDADLAQFRITAIAARRAEDAAMFRLRPGRRSRRTSAIPSARRISTPAISTPIPSPMFTTTGARCSRTTMSMPS